ncbi:MAG: MlrC C-terminal domain-containing protein [Desulfobacterales bacterium]|nr:MlrC C-terminal domain-containing protein [Desulfobacterales bacterium]
MRHEFWQVRRLAPQEAIRRAVQAPSGPVIICDASDSVLSGVPGDSTCLLEEMLRQQIPCLALLPLVDAQVIAQAFAAGTGAEIDAAIGGKLDQVYGKTILVRERVGGLVEGGMVFTLGRLGASDMGRCALLELGNVRVVVSENRGIGGTHPDIYRRFGIDPAQAKMIVVKTYFNYQMFAPLYKDVIWADCPGLSGWDLRQFKWVKAPRPLFPLDDLAEWQA